MNPNSLLQQHYRAMRRLHRERAPRSFLVGQGRFAAPGPKLSADPTDEEVMDAIRSVPMHFADLTITAANVVPAATAIFDRQNAGATITAGQSLYSDATDSNKMKLADANASASTAAAIGISVHAALAGQPISYITGGDLGLGAILTAGLIYVVSATAGAIAPAADLASGWYTTILGYATSTSNLRMALKSTGVVLA